MYRTGDLVKWLPDGNIEFLGRIDHQVKVRGFRIELGEVEAILDQHPAVQQVVVLVLEDRPGEKRLVAYFVPARGQAPTVGGLRHFLREKLPDYMVPSAFVTLEALPLMPNGKVDRRALPAPEWVRPELSETFVTPRTPITVAALAEHIETASRIEQGSQTPPIPRVSREKPLPLSLAQQQLWLIDQLKPGNAAYNSPFRFRLNGSLDVAILQTSLNEIVRRHEALRTTFVVVDEQPVQVVAPNSILPLPVIDLCQLPQAEREAEARHLTWEEARQPFDLAKGPLLRTTLLQLGQTEHLLLLTLHHIVFDGWSVSVLLAELEALYTAFAAGKPSPLPDLPIQYADFALWQREWSQGKTLETQLAYWKHQLDGAPAVLELPTDRPRPSVQTFCGDCQLLTLSAPLSEALKALSQREGVTLFMTLLAAFEVLLYHYTGQEDIVVGTPVANRSRPEIEELIGFFVNTLVIRTSLAGDPSFLEFLARVREIALGAYTHQDLPFEKLVQMLQPERDMSHNPLFQVMFVLHNTPMAMPALPDLSVTPATFDTGMAPFDLSLEMEDTEQGLAGFIEYNTDLFDDSTVARMVEHLQTLLESITTDPGQNLSTLLSPIVPIVSKPQQDGVPSPGTEDDAASRKAQRAARRAARRARIAAERANLLPEKRALLEERLRREFSTTSKPSKIPRRLEPGPVPLSFAQQRLWFIDQWEPGSPYYNISSALRFTGPLNMAALQQSLNEVVRRHEALRTTFVAVEGRPVQVIAPVLTVLLPVVDLRGLAEAEREAEARRLASEEARWSFDLARGPLVRVTVLRLGEACPEPFALRPWAEAPGTLSQGQSGPRVLGPKPLVSLILGLKDPGLRPKPLVLCPRDKVDAGDQGQGRREEYTLLVTMHHIVSDGWSKGVFIQEMATLYRALATGEPSSLPELPIQYADFAAWQREWLQGEVLEKQLSYWKKQLADAPAVLELPTDRPRPPVQTYQGATESFVLSETLTEALQALSRQERSTLFMTLLTAFDTLLYRYTGQDDIPLGSPIANRNWSEIEGLIGFFVNTLVLRTDLSGNPTFRELLGRVREVTLGAYTHQDLPFEMLVEQLQPERDLSRTPLFQVMFALRNAPVPFRGQAGPTFSPLEIDSRTAKFDLTLFIVETARGLRGVLEYNTDLFDATTISRMVGHFQTLLEGIVADPDHHIADVPILTETERYQLLVEWNDTEVEYPQDQCIHELFEAQVERTPDAVAVVFEDQHLTYRELNRRANQLARHLQRLGVGSEVLVGICVKRSLEMVVQLLGVLKAGGAYLPLDPEYPQERLAFMLEDTQSPVLLTQQELVERLPAHRVQVVCLDRDWETIAWVDEKNLADRATADNLAYVIYTSGSTGRPKGVAIQHRSAVVLIHWALDTFDNELSAGTLASTSICFDLSIFELFVPLSCGGTVILAETALHLSDLPAAEAITLINTVPSVMRELLRVDGVPASVRVVNLAGELLQTDLVQQIYRKETIQRVFDLYGPSEDTTYSTYALRSPTGAATIGRPIANTQVYLLDASLNPVPVGVVGELYIGGEGLARGYLYRPDLTAERFIPNPFSDEPGARLYRTGDLVRYLPDGRIEFLGRADYQVKIRGFRIELGEIEAVLGQHPALRETVVLAREDVPGDPSSPPRPEPFALRPWALVLDDKYRAEGPRVPGPKDQGRDEGLRAGNRLVAYVVPNDGQEPTVSELRRFLREKLPEYMVPSAFVTLEALPLTPNGKVDRRALPAPERAGFDLTGTLVPPRDILELRLLQIWEDVLGVQPIGVTHNFFDLGGHSLLAVHLMARVQQELGQRLPLATLFQDATVGHLATVLRQHQGAVTPSSSLVPIQAGNSNERPLFFVHPVGGNVFCYADLSRHLGPDQPFYGLQAQGLDGEKKPHTRVESMASHYIELLQTVQTQGPYLLGGWSLGGVVAFEMAQQLQAQGQEVALLALIDSYALTGDQEPEPDDVTLLGDLALDLGLPLNQIAFERDRFEQLEPDERLAYVLEEAKRAGVVPPDIELIQVRHLFQVFKSNVQAMRRYVPHAYPGPIALFKASEQFDEQVFAEDLGWGTLAAGGITVHVVPGNHYTVIREPNVEALAGQLEHHLRIAGATGK